jgi:hypothetical protein
MKRMICAATCIFAILIALNIAPAAAGDASHGLFEFGLSHRHPDILVLVWKGPVNPSMADQIGSAFLQYRSQIRGVELKLDSPGGSVVEGERAISVLQEIKKTTKLHTVVEAGARCASMCVFIYAQGDKRLAAPASLWLFHEVSHKDPRTHEVFGLDRQRWLGLCDKYLLPAGVNPTWMDHVKAHTFGSNYWESGDTLLAEQSSLVQVALSNQQIRILRGKNAEQIGSRTY